MGTRGWRWWWNLRFAWATQSFLILCVCECECHYCFSGSRSKIAKCDISYVCSASVPIIRVFRFEFIRKSLPFISNLKIFACTRTHAIHRTHLPQKSRCLHGSCALCSVHPKGIKCTLDNVVIEKFDKNNAIYFQLFSSILKLAQMDAVIMLDFIVFI